MALHPSEFDDFTSDYDKINHIDTPSYTKRKIYEKNYWLVYPNKNLAIRMGETKPYLRCFLKTAGEQFGDAITPLDIADYTIVFKCVNEGNNMIIMDTATVTNASLGEITYEFKALDFPTKGRYYGMFEFTKDDEVFTLPPESQRIEIIVS